VGRDAREVTADKGYDTNATQRHLEANGQRSSIIIKKNRVNLHTDGVCAQTDGETAGDGERTS
jgi:hypothetical protein